jgi:hypothetical protein
MLDESSSATNSPKSTEIDRGFTFEPWLHGRSITMCFPLPRSLYLELVPNASHLLYPGNVVAGGVHAGKLPQIPSPMLT